VFPAISLCAGALRDGASWLGRAQSMPRIVQAVARRWPGLAALGKVASSQQL